MSRVSKAINTLREVADDRDAEGRFQASDFIGVAIWLLELERELPNNNDLGSDE